MGYSGDLPPHKRLDKDGKLREPEGELLDSINESMFGGGAPKIRKVENNMEQTRYT